MVITISWPDIHDIPDAFLCMYLSTEVSPVPSITSAHPRCPCRWCRARPLRPHQKTLPATPTLCTASDMEISNCSRHKPRGVWCSGAGSLGTGGGYGRLGRSAVSPPATLSSVAMNPHMQIHTCRSTHAEVFMYCTTPQRHSYCTPCSEASKVAQRPCSLELFECLQSRLPRQLGPRRPGGHLSRVGAWGWGLTGKRAAHALRGALP